MQTIHLRYCVKSNASKSAILAPKDHHPCSMRALGVVDTSSDDANRELIALFFVGAQGRMDCRDKERRI